jgi:hypothetical protein
LDDSAAMSSHSFAHNATHRSQVRRFAMEYPILRGRMSLMNEVCDSTEQNDGSRETTPARRRSPMMISINIPTRISENPSLT